MTKYKYILLKAGHEVDRFVTLQEAVTRTNALVAGRPNTWASFADAVKQGYRIRPIQKEA